jgi:hypothetical protein
MSKFKNAEQFFNEPAYLEAKDMYERQYFKLLGSYRKYDGDTIEKIAVSSMMEHFKNKQIVIEKEVPTIKKGILEYNTKELNASYYDIWSYDPNMREFDKVVFNCDIESVGPKEFNLFENFNHFDHLEKKDFDLSLIFDHIMSLVNDDEDDFKYVISWLAQLIQQPHILPQTALIFISEEGVGKDCFSSFLSKVIGSQHTANVSNLNDICGDFNAILNRKLLITVNETDPVESKKRSEALKNLITAETVVIRGLYENAIKCDNYVRLLFFSNRLFAYPMEEKARRPKIMKCSNRNSKKVLGIEENKIYFDKLWALSKKKNKDYQHAFLNYLRNYDISNFNPSAFKKSELHKNLEENSVNPLVSFMSYYLSLMKKETTFKASTTEVLKLFNEFMREQGNKFDYSQRKLNVELRDMFDIETRKSGGTIHFVIDPMHIKSLLVTKFEYVEVNENGDEADNNSKDADNLNHGVPPIDPYKEKYDALQIDFNKQKKEMEDLLKKYEALEAAFFSKYHGSNSTEEPAQKPAPIEEPVPIEEPKPTPKETVKPKRTKSEKAKTKAIKFEEESQDIDEFDFRRAFD